DIADHVDELATDKVGLLGIGLVQRPAPHADPDEAAGDDRDEEPKCRRHIPIDGGEDDERAEEVGARRNDVPGEGADERPDGARRAGNAVAERTREIVAEIAHRVAGEMTEQVEPDVDAGGDDGLAAEPAAEAPQHVLDEDEADEEREGEADAILSLMALRHRVDEQ